MYTDLHVKYLLFLSSFNETWIFSIDLKKKKPKIKFHKAASSGSQTVPYRRTDMMMLTVAFHNYLNVSKSKLNDNNRNTPHTNFNNM